MDTHDLRTAAKVVYLAAEEPIADDLAEKLNWAADKIDLLTGMLSKHYPKSQYAFISNEKVLTPFTESDPTHLAQILDSIVKCPLPIEVFDAFLAEYAELGDLDKARFFAQCEWDC